MKRVIKLVAFIILIFAGTIASSTNAMSECAEVKDNKTDEIICDKIKNWYMAFINPFSISFNGYYTGNYYKTDNHNDSAISRSSDIQGAYNGSIKYTMPLSTIYYIVSDTPLKKPNPYLRNIKLYAEGSWGNTITSDKNATYPLITKSSTSYKFGVKAEMSFEDMIHGLGIKNFPKVKDSTSENY